jgi:hypothetical protein
MSPTASSKPRLTQVPSIDPVLSAPMPLRYGQIPPGTIQFLAVAWRLDKDGPDDQDEPTLRPTTPDSDASYAERPVLGPWTPLGLLAGKTPRLADWLTTDPVPTPSHRRTGSSAMPAMQAGSCRHGCASGGLLTLGAFGKFALTKAIAPGVRPWEISLAVFALAGKLWP